MRLEEVLSAAIAYARYGHPLLERASATIATVKDQFLTHWPTSAALWLDQGNVPAPGVMFCNAVLAETYERVLRESSGPGGRDAEIERARRVWSQGLVADAIDRFCRTQEVMDVSGRAHRGVLTGADMATWSAAVEAPIGYDYGRYHVQKPGPWCQGLVTLQQLAILKHFQFDGLDPVGADFIHWQVEAAKLAFADRDTFYGDPDFVTVPVEILLSDVYSAKRQALISERASLDQRPGAIPGYGKMLETRLGSDRTAVGSGGAGEPTVGRRGESKGDTVHFDIVDRFGNMVAATPSGGWLQSSPSIPERGFCLGTRAQMFTMDEQHPACLAPGKRPRSTLSPTMALRDGEPYLAWGSPGGDQQDQWIPQFFLRHVHAGYISKKRSTLSHGTLSIFPRHSGPVPPDPACLLLKTECRTRPSSNWRNAVILWSSDRTGRKDGLSPPRSKKIA
jgi:gamma-glutamyltranspeptidase / glutathione hydrolase